MLPYGNKGLKILIPLLFEICIKDFIRGGIT
jgi:hypothetical protein